MPVLIFKLMMLLVLTPLGVSTKTEYVVVPVVAIVDVVDGSVIMLGLSLLLRG